MIRFYSTVLPNCSRFAYVSITPGVRKRKMEIKSVIQCIVMVAQVLVTTVPAYAYMGPGAGLTALGSLLALLGIIVLAVLGFLWYPIKRLLAKRAAKNRSAANESADRS